MNDNIQDAINKGLISVEPSNPFKQMIADTVPLEAATNPGWWQLRALMWEQNGGCFNPIQIEGGTL